MRSHQARCIPVTVDDEGIDVVAVERELARNNVKLIYVMPTFQNPTGAALSFERRLKLIELAKQYRVPILEDNFVGDLAYDSQSMPPLRALPGGRDVVIHQGTFSKALCPGLRLGWLVAPREVMSRLLLAKRVSDLSTNSMAQLTLAHYLSAGLYAKHLEHVRSAYRSRRDTMLSALSKAFKQTDPRFAIKWSKPQGGLFIWSRLPAALSARQLLRFAEQEGVTFSPGDLFFLSGDRQEFMRLCFIQNNDEQIQEGIRRLGIAYQKYLDTLLETGSVARIDSARNRDQVLI
jgi:GntR family transcriptional regulator/MocR family aminotransferase